MLKTRRILKSEEKNVHNEKKKSQKDIRTMSTRVDYMIK